MVFNKKGFFLELGDGSTSETPAVSIPVREIEADDEASTADAQQPVALAVSNDDSAPVAASDPAVSPAASPKETATPSATAAQPAAAKPSTTKGPSLTTAEAIAAELAAAEAARPEVTLSTFAVEALQPGKALRPQKRRPGANLKGFRSMAEELFKSSSTGRETSL